MLLSHITLKKNNKVLSGKSVALKIYQLINNRQPNSKEWEKQLSSKYCEMVSISVKPRPTLTLVINSSS